MELRLSFLPNFPWPTFIQGGTFTPDSRVLVYQGWVKLLMIKYPGLQQKSKCS